MRGMILTGAVCVAAGCAGEPTATEATASEAAVLQLAGYAGMLPAAPPNPPAQVPLRWTREPTAGDVVPFAVIDAPEAVRAGQAFAVTTRTVGQSGCWRAAGQRVERPGGRVVELRPRDAHSGAAICTAMVVFPEHRSEITIHEAGEHTLRVVGRRVVDGMAGEEPVAVERTILVR